MYSGSSDRVPASSLILFASIVFTIITYGTFTLLWGVNLPSYLLVVVLGFQFGTLLLGSSKILTQLGAASLSALMAVTACIAAVFVYFPPSMELRIAGAAAGISSLIFIMASFVAASRADPVPVGTLEPLDLEIPDDIHEAELIKYGEVQAPEPNGGNDLPLIDTRWEKEGEGYDLFPGDELSGEIPPSPIVLSEGSAGPAADASPPDHRNQVDNSSALYENETAPAGLEWKSGPPGGWVEETARFMAYETTRDRQIHEPPGDGVSEEGWEGTTSVEEDTRSLKMRTRFKILDAVSGTHYCTCYGDEGYSTLAPEEISGLPDSRIPAGDLRIVKLDWSNFDEVEVHIQVEEIPDQTPITGIENESVDSAAATLDRPESQEFEAEVTPPAEKNQAADTGKPPSYMIYDRRTIQPMGEYVPEGERSRIDRLTLYRMFPEYDFKTFEIDSIRWEAGEVRVFIKGEKKKSSESGVQDTEIKPGKRKLPDEN